MTQRLLSAPSTLSLQSPMNKGTILIIDDEKDLVELVRYNLDD
jgi:hypothetical protein